MKNLPTGEEDKEENRKIIDIINEKTFKPRLKTGKEKPRLVERKGTCLRKDLVKKRLDQNKVLRSSSTEPNRQWSTTMQASQHSLR